MSEQASSEAVPQRHLAVRAVLRTDVGLVRSENQDFGTYTTATEESTSHPGGRLLIVADGMGGHRGGATASRLAGETVKTQYLGSETNDIPTALRQSLSRANARIFSEAQSNPELRGMGTTTSVLAVRDQHGWLAHVGDSRIYLVRDGEIQQLTDDHSLVATMVREGLLTSRGSGDASAAQRAAALDGRGRGRRDRRQRPVRAARRRHVHPLQRRPARRRERARVAGDRRAGRSKRPRTSSSARALERGAPDNVTVIVARVEVTDEPPRVTLVDAMTLRRHAAARPTSQRRPVRRDGAKRRRN